MGHIVRYTTDLPTTKDALGFDDYRQALTEILLCGDTPLVVGIFGRWGSGKTSLLKMLREDVKKKRGQAHERVRTVWFTAWKYQRQEVLWRAFILRILDALYPREKPSDDVSKPWEERPRVKWENLKGDEKIFVEKLLRLEESLYGPVEWTEQGQIHVDVRRLSKEGSKAITQIMLNMLSGGGILPVVRQILGGQSQALNVEEIVNAFQREVRTRRMAQMTSMEQFEGAFQELLEEALGKDGGEDGRLIIFVDDLDRCLPEKAIELLEAIKLFLNVKRTVFVLGLDKDIIQQGIEIYYRQSGVESPIRGDDYLEKIIQIPFHLPPPETQFVQDYIKMLLEDKDTASRSRSSASSETVETQRDAPEDSETMLRERKEEQCGVPEEIRGSGVPEGIEAILLEGLLPNPRQIKRALNTFRLLQTVAIIRQQRLLGQVPIPWILLAKVVILQIQYPAFFNMWIHHPDVQWIQQFEKHLEQDDPHFPQDVQEAWEVLSMEQRSAILRLFRLQPGDAASSRFQAQERHVLERLRTLASPLAVAEELRSILDDFEQALERGEASKIFQTAINLMYWRSPKVLEEAQNLLRQRGRDISPVIFRITSHILKVRDLERDLPSLINSLLDEIEGEESHG